MNRAELRLPAGLLGGRRRGLAIRRELEKVSDGYSKPVRLDFSGVETLSHSAADELIGVPLRTLGESVLDLLEFSGCNEAVRSALKYVAWDSVNRATPPPALSLRSGTALR